MENNQFILPINNQYSYIDLPTLNSNKYKTPILKRKSIDKSAILEIAKYNNQLIKDNQKKEEINLKGKKIIIKEINPISQKSTYYEKIDMLTYTPKKKEDDELQTVNQNYLKSFSNLDIPLAQTKNTFYEFNSKTLNSKILNQNVNKILEYSFFEMNSVISTPYFLITPKNIIINLFYFCVNKELSEENFLLRKKNIVKLEGLSYKLSNYFKKPVKLDLTRLYSISHNSQILIHVLGKLSLFRSNSFSKIVRTFLRYQSHKMMFRSNFNKFSKSVTILTGINIKLGGRLMRGKIVPRRTVNKIQYGSLSRSKANYVTTARLTQKNKRGAFSFTVSIGHKFF